VHPAETGVAPAVRAGDPSGLIYVLLPIHNRRVVTERFVRCLAAQTDQRFHLVLVDDGSSDGSADMVTERIQSPTVLRGSGAWWWAGSLQQAYIWLRKRELSAADLVLIANDDTRFDADFLALARRVLTSRRTLLLAQLHGSDAGPLVEVGVHVDWAAFQFVGVQEPNEVNCLSTRGLFLFAREFVELGGFHPRLLPHYGSDYEFTIRARRNGFSLRSDPSVWLWYDETTTGIRVISSDSLRSFLHSTLTTRSVANPFYLTTFLLLACPRRYLPRNLFRVWRSFVSGILAAGRGR
jgi:GT2 family glycosyltransferase